MPITLSKTYPKQLKMTFDDYCKPMLFPMKKYMNAVRYLFILFFFKRYGHYNCFREILFIDHLGENKDSLPFNLIYVFFFIKYPYLLMIFFSYCISI